jgi:RNA polymerase sigma-70 factor (sigma-E family)
VSVGGDHDGQGARGKDVTVDSERTGHRQKGRPAVIRRAPEPRSADLDDTPEPAEPTSLDLDSAVRELDQAVPRQLSSGPAGEADFREFVSSRGRALLRSAYLLTGNLADAEDLVQSALAKTYVAWDRIEDRRALDGYVRRAMINTHISWWRRRRLDEYPTDEIPDLPVADTSGTSELRDALQRAIDRLPLRMRAAVVLRFFEDMTEAEVADVLGVSQGTVKSTVSRAVAKLRTDAELLAE